MADALAAKVLIRGWWWTTNSWRHRFTIKVLGIPHWLGVGLRRPLILWAGRLGYFQCLGVTRSTCFKSSLVMISSLSDRRLLVKVFSRSAATSCVFRSRGLSVFELNGRQTMYLGSVTKTTYHDVAGPTASESSIATEFHHSNITT
jgi:hypothetical protein